MPQHVIYTAQRELVSGHSAGTDYTLDLSLAKKERTGRSRRSVQYSLSNRGFVTFQNVADTWKCATIPLSGTNADNMREFLYSALDQIFSFDPNNASTASPTAPVNVVIEGASVTEKRAARTGTQANDYFVFTFTLRAVSNA